MSSLQLADVRLHYEWIGRADLPVLLLSNGLGTNLSMWSPQVEEFSRHFRVLRYDPRGHGQSSIPPGPYSIEQMGRDVVALLDDVGIESCYFCGLSMGGAVGQWLGVNAAGKLRKLVLCNTAAKIGTPESWNTRIAAVNEHGVTGVIPLVLDRWFTSDFQIRRPEIVARTREMFVATDPAGYVAGCAAIRDMNQRDTLCKIVTPTLIVAGKHDLVTPPGEGRYLAAAIAGSQYVELEAAHLSSVEAAESFSSAVLEFLAGDMAD